jgi:hypothetical protein
MERFAELISNDANVRHYAAIACIYMGRRLANGELSLIAPRSDSPISSPVLS